MAQTQDHCLLCGQDSLRKDDFAAATLNLASEHSVSQCCHCGFRFLNPRPTAQDYEELYSCRTGPLAEAYPMPQEFYGEHQKRRLGEYQDKLDILLKYGATGRILEIGSCTGLFMNAARNRGFEAEGIEPSKKNCLIALETFGLKLHEGSAEDFDFPADSFEAVFSSNVFEHLSDPLAVAKRVTSWLKPGGVAHDGSSERVWNSAQAAFSFAGQSQAKSPIRQVDSSYSVFCAGDASLTGSLERMWNRAR